MKLSSILILESYDLNYSDWEYVKKDFESMTFKNKKTGKLIV